MRRHLDRSGEPACGRLCFPVVTDPTEITCQKCRYIAEMVVDTTIHGHKYRYRAAKREPAA